MASDKYVIGLDFGIETLKTNSDMLSDFVKENSC